jgi:hypothetical protein
MASNIWQALPKGGVAAHGDQAAAAGVQVGHHAAQQGLTLVHFSAQPKRFLWDGGGGV